MAAAGKKKQSGRVILQKEDVLQAIVVADSFNTRFLPVTQAKPRTLLPFANVPLLDYTLRFLVEAGIQEIFVYCCAHAEQIKQHLRRSGWMNGLSYTVRTIVNEECVSVGDALRDMDGKSLIKSDFVLLSGDVISNIKLGDVMRKHKERVKVDKQCVMTMVMKVCQPDSGSRCKEDDVVLAVQTDNGKLLHFQKMHTNYKRLIQLPTTVLSEENTAGVRLHYDLLDCHISICSPSFLPLFSDNFDYQTRDAFIHGILVNEEILGNTIYTHVVDTEYGARVGNWVMYDRVSQDILSRWGYPIVPGSATSASREVYSYNRYNIYLAQRVTQARDSRLKANVQIGSGSEIGPGTCIAKTTIGRNCKIGRNVKLHHCYIWDNVIIDDGCELEYVVVCDQAHLKQKTIVRAGCVISYEVIAGPNVTIPEQTYLISKPGPDAESEKDAYGDSERAFVWKPAEEDDEDTDDLILDIWGLSFHGKEEEEFDYEALASSDEEGETLPGTPQAEDDTTVFYDEVMHTLARAEEEDLTADNIVLEINSLKHAYNITIREVNQFVIKATVHYPLKTQPSLDAAAYLIALKSLLRRLMDVLKNYIKREEAHLDCLNTLESECIVQPVIGNVLVHVLKILYDSDVLDEEIIISWFQSKPQDKNPERVKVRQQLVPFIKWLQEAEEESDDSS